MIYFDNAATTAVKPAGVGQAVAKVLTSGEYGNPGRDASKYSLNSGLLVQQTREKVARLFHVPSSDNVMFTNNATDSLNVVLKGLLHAGDHVITTDYEHNSVLRPLAQLKQQGVQVSYLPFAPETGQLQIKQLSQMLTPATKAVVCTHASNVTGYVLPLAAISQFCQEQGLWLIVDAAQTAGFLDIDVQQQGIDALCFTGHKSLYGPQGIGGICLKTDLPITPLKSGGTGVDSFNPAMPAELPTRLEAGTLNVPGIAGLGAGIDYLTQTGLQPLRKHVLTLVDQLLTGLAQYPEITIYTPKTAMKTGAVAFNVGTINSAEVGQWLWDTAQIATRTGAHCAPRVLIGYGVKQQGIVRISLSSFNTAEQVATFLTAIAQLIASYRQER